MRRARASLAEERSPPSFFAADPGSRESVEHFQRAHEVEVDGVIGPQTRRALGIERARLLGIDPTDAGSVARFQREHGLVADGAIGPALDDEIAAILQALRGNGTLSKARLRREAHASRWGPGRFGRALRASLEEGLVRQVVRNRFSAR